jgi:protocatechuate 3,4-dioxygenase beta subunit
VRAFFHASCWATAVAALIAAAIGAVVALRAPRAYAGIDTETPTATATSTFTAVPTNTPLIFATATPSANHDSSNNPGDVDSLPFSTSEDTSLATLEFAEPQPCGDIGKTLWYLYRPSYARHIVIDTTGSEFDTVVAVYTRTFSPPGGLESAGCADEGPGGVAEARLELDVSPSFDYLVQVGGAGGAGGLLELSIAGDPPGGAITGTITDGNGDPISGAAVIGDSVVCCTTAFALAAADGTFAMSDVAPGTYRVRAAAFGYVSEYYDGVFTFFEADDVVVAPDGLVAGIDISLGAGGSISGVVRDGDGNPIDGAYMFAGSDACCFSNYAYTAADGSYTIAGLTPGMYRVQAQKQGFAQEYYDNVFGYNDATLVGVNEDATTPDIDFDLGTGGAIAGKITDQNGDPLFGASIYANRVDACCGSGYTNSADDGTYTMTGLVPGVYRVYVEAFGYPTRFYDGTYSYADAAPVFVADAATTPEVDVQMLPGGTISGTVTEGDGVTPIEGALISVDLNACCFGASTVTDASGNYALPSLPAGEYRVRAAADGFAAEYYVDAYEYFAATLVPLAPGGDADVDFALEVGGSISGTITDIDGNPIAGANVSAEPDQCCSGFVSTVSAADGTYTLSGMIPGDYRIVASAAGYATAYYDNTPNYFDATLVAVALGTDTPGIDIALAAEASISGTVTDEYGTPIANAYVYANSDVCCLPGGYAYTDANGQYTIGGLPAGAYRVIGTADGYVEEYFDNAPYYELATIVTVAAGDEATGIDFALTQAGSISGTVTDGLGEPILGAWVTADSTACCYGAGTYSDASGNYTLGNLPPGDYVVHAEADQYAGEFYNDVYDFDAATLVPITSGGETSDIDFALSNGGGISGTVVDADGNPLADVYVWADRDGCCDYAETWTGPDGSYVIEGLSPGSYRVAADASGFVFEYYDNVRNFNEATLVAVVDGVTTPGIDFELAEPDPDNIADAKQIFSLPFTDNRNTTGAGVEEGEPQPCGNIGATVWYRFLVPQSPPLEVDVAIDIAGSDFPVVIALYSSDVAFSPPGAATLIGCSDSPAVPITFEANAANGYYIQVGGEDAATGDLVIKFVCESDAECDGVTDNNTVTPTPTQTLDPDATATFTPTQTPTPTPVYTSTHTPTPTPTYDIPGSTATTAAQHTATAASQPTATASPSSTPISGPAGSVTVEATPTADETPDDGTPSPESTASPQSTSTTAASATAEATAETPTAEASVTSSPVPTSTLTPTPTPTKTSEPDDDTRTPSPTRTTQASPTRQASATPATAVSTVRPPSPSPQSDVLGAGRQPGALPNAGGGASGKSTTTASIVAIVSAMLLTGTMLMTSRRRRRR